MIDRLFPQWIHKPVFGAFLARWVFVLLMLVTIARSLAHILPDGGAQSIATIPLDTFTINGGHAHPPLRTLGPVTTSVRSSLCDCTLAVSVADPTHVSFYSRGVHGAAAF